MHETESINFLPCYIYDRIGTVYAQDESEELTLTTYYPAPYGDYDAIVANKIGIDDPDQPADYSAPVNNGDLIVEGKVGIQTSNPMYALEVMGTAKSGTVNTTVTQTKVVDLFNYTTTPPSAQEGRIYYSSTYKKLYFHNGTDFIPVQTASAGSRVKSGTYTGNGVSDTVIEVGFRPHYVQVMRANPSGSYPSYMRYDNWTDNICTNMVASGSYSNIIRNFTDTGFRVGNSTYSNGDGATYNYVAIEGSN